jgi:sec-independent protein translocase protein TatA
MKLIVGRHAIRDPTDEGCTSRTENGTNVASSLRAEAERPHTTRSSPETGTRRSSETVELRRAGVLRHSNYERVTALRHVVSRRRMLIRVVCSIRRNSRPDATEVVMLGEIIGPDILIILLVVLVLFGGSQLPKLARSLGSAKNEFQKGLAEGDKIDGATPETDNKKPQTN